MFREVADQFGDRNRATQLAMDFHQNLLDSPAFEWEHDYARGVLVTEAAHLIHNIRPLELRVVGVWKPLPHLSVYATCVHGA